MTENRHQWPLFEVFVRSRNGLEHKHSSSLHASDAHHALMLARDVYTRRQEGVSLWVIPATDVSESDVKPAAARFDAPVAFEAFVRLKPGLDHKHMGSVMAQDAAEALAAAAKAFGEYPLGGLWVAPASAIVATVEEESAEFFDPMADKTYRMPTFYSLPEAVNNM